MVPALLFLCVGVPLAELLDRLGYFEAVAALVQGRGAEVRVGVLWTLACVTTAILNLDTTVVLLTPLSVRLARRSGTDPFTLALIPLFTAAFASSFLPVSNLTTLIVTERLDLTVADVLTHLAIPGFAACVVGWIVFRRGAPRILASVTHDVVDRRVLTIGSCVVAGLLVGFVFGGLWGIDPWVVALVADLLLALVTRTLPWRSVPVFTATGVAMVGLATALLVPASATHRLATVDAPLALAGTVGIAAGVANVVNNLPATLIGLEGVDSATWGMWAWLLGVNTGSVILPLGALANILWWRIVRREEVDVDVRTYVRATVPVAVPALIAAALCLAVASVLSG